MRRWAHISLGLLVLGLYGTPGRSQQAKTGVRRPEVWAVVVGIGDHDDPTIAGGKTSVREANSVLRWLRGPAGWDRSHSLFLRDLGSQDPGTPDAPAAIITPTKKNLDWAFRVWLRSKAKPGDTIVFYFAGRSAAVVKPRDGLDDDVSYVILPTDAKRDNSGATGWSLDEALDDLAEHGPYQVVCWLGTTIETAGGGKNAAKSSTTKWLERLARWPGVTAWLAGDESGQGEEASPEPAPLFTTALLAGLGTPDRPNNLASCLRTLHENAALKRQGFRTIGGVGPGVTLWSKLTVEAGQVPNPEMVLQVGHADQITALAATADGDQVLSAAMDSSIRVWSAAERTLLRIIPGHEVGTTCLALTADGRWLFSGDGRGEVLAHDVSRDFAPRLVARQPHRRPIAQVVPLPDRKHVLSVDRDGVAFMWDVTVSPLQPRPWAEATRWRDVVCSADDDGTIAALGDDGAARTFGPDGQGGTRVEGPRGPVSTLAISPDGHWLALGSETEPVVVRDLVSGKMTTAHESTAGARLLRFSRQNHLAVGGESKLVLTSVGSDWSEGTELLDQPPRQVVFSPDGSQFAASAASTGALRVWRTSEDGKVQPLVTDEAARVNVITFSGDGRMLILGGHDGSIRTQFLEAGDREVHAWIVPPNRGKVRQVGTSPDRRHLLLRNDLAQVQLWDLKGRVCRRLPGRWASAAFLDDERMVLSPSPDASAKERGLTVLAIESLEPAPAFFARSSAEFKIDPDIVFTEMVVSADGTRVAASADPSQVPLVCVWDARTGRLTHWCEALDSPIVSLDFSADARVLVGASEGPEARLWDLTARDGKLNEPAATFADPGARNMTRVVVRPGYPEQVVTGHSDGRVVLWRRPDGKAKAEHQNLVEGVFPGAVHALTFTPDGKYLAAAGDGTTLWLGEMDPTPRRLRDLGPRPHHYEQINSLAAWRGVPVLISGSDDTTVRFWDLKTRTLWGTFSATSGALPQNERQDALPRESDWVFYTPDGLFDASAEGRTRVRFRHRDQAHALEQFDNTHYTFQLAEKLRNGEPVTAKAPTVEAPGIAIQTAERADSSKPEAELTVSLNSADLNDVRVYHNGVPISCGFEPGQPIGTKRFPLRVRLLKGTNRFYAMAGREGAADGRSRDVVIQYDGPMEPGRLHVLSLGVGDYSRRRLQYAERDAEELSEVLHNSAFQGDRKGLRIVLANERVDEANLGKAFREIEQRVKKRPQDTVVVFLAGHTGVFDGSTWCLLRPSFPFPAQEPITVAERGNGLLEPGANLKPEHLLPYSSIARYLMRLDALNRLVIVDACQAEAILEDPRVNDIQRWMEIGSRRARTSYIMASRRGEPALEVDPLRHGLLTFTLLRGMGAIRPVEEPDEVKQLALPRNADLDADGILTTGELDQYVKQSLPLIARQFPLMVTSRRAALVEPKLPAPSPGRLQQEVRTQGAEYSFPLIPLRARPPG